MQFTALTLLVWQPEGHLTCKSPAQKIPRSSLLGTGLTWKNMPGKQKLKVVVVIVQSPECTNQSVYSSPIILTENNHYYFSN